MFLRAATVLLNRGHRTTPSRQVVAIAKCAGLSESDWTTLHVRRIMVQIFWTFLHELPKPKPSALSRCGMTETVLNDSGSSHDAEHVSK